MMFPDNFRFVKIIISFLALSLLVFYIEIQGPKIIPGVKEFTSHPTQFINKEIGFQGKIIKIEEKHFVVEQILEQVKMNLTIQGTLSKAKPKDTISFVATYQTDKSLTLNRYIISNSRPIKIAVSLVALLIVTFLFFRDFTFDFKKMVFKQKA